MLVSESGNGSQFERAAICWSPPGDTPQFAAAKCHHAHYTYTYRDGSLPLQPFPSKIWQSRKDDSEPERTAGFPHQWRIVNPGWRYERITDTNNDAYVQSSFARIAEVFTKLNDPVMKADYLRYLILLREGGVWADIDVSPSQPISEWIPKQYRGSVNLVIGIENDHHKEPIW
ncbi:hypothetical protein V493_01060, partial [Pseudogymnoascus sp. VKM F-4281 (FW-2241)]